MRVEDDDWAANRLNVKRDRGNDKREEGSGKNNKRDDWEGERKHSFEAFKRVNTIFNMLIHKIMFEIQ